jgi:hypothetical protein
MAGKEGLQELSRTQGERQAALSVTRQIHGAIASDAAMRRQPNLPATPRYDDSDFEDHFPDLGTLYLL